MRNVFEPANILIPKNQEMKKWSVIACDQFTSQPEYWERVEEYVGEAPSTLKMILPEAKLEEESENTIDQIRKNMETYLNEDLFKNYEDSFVYVERTLLDGSVRKGIVGAMNLEEYDYTIGSMAAIRATEKTVVERIPPRKRIRQNALLEFPHVLLFADDEKDLLCGYLESVKEELPVVYDFELMEGGGHILGRLVSDRHKDHLMEKMEIYGDGILEKYASSGKVPMLFAVADGNHSLATAKACYEDIKLQNPGKE